MFILKAIMNAINQPSFVSRGGMMGRRAF